jgi:WD40 repeat protein
VWLYAASDFAAAPRAAPHSYWVGVNAIAWSPDGALLAFGDSENLVHVLDVRAGVERFTLVGHVDFVEGVAFSPDGTLLASAGSSRDRTIRLWDMSTGQQVRLLEGHTSGVSGVAWSPDGTRLVSGGDDLRVWDVATGQTLLVMSDFYNGPECVAWSPDGSRLAFGSYEGMFAWDAATSQKLYSVPGSGGAVTAVAFSPDGALLAYGGQDNSVHLLEVQTGRELIALTNHTEPIIGINWSPDGALLASAAGDGTVRVWGLAGTAAGSSAPSTGSETPLPATDAGASGACTITLSEVAFLFPQPNMENQGPDFEVVSAGANLELNGQTTGADGMTWYRLSSGKWALGLMLFMSTDVPPECADLPVVSP